MGNLTRVAHREHRSGHDDRMIVRAPELIGHGGWIGIDGELSLQALRGKVVVLGFWGAGSLSFYGLCVAHAIDRTPKSLIPQVMSGLLFVWAAGSIFGPLLSGFATRAAGRLGLFGLAGVLLITLAAIMVWRVRQKPVSEEEKIEEWSPILPTPLAGVELDPRSPESEEESPSQQGEDSESKV